MKNIKFYTIIISIVIINMIVMNSCNKSIEVDCVYITAAEKLPLTNFSARNSGDAMGITVSSALIAQQNIEGTLSINNNLVEDYNKKNGTNYEKIDLNTCSLSDKNIKIESGKYRSEVIKLVVNDIEGLKKGINYLLPIQLKSNNSNYPSLPGSDILYVIINRTLLVNVPKLSGSNGFKVNFKDNNIEKLQNLEEFTMEIKVNMWDFPKYYGGNLMGIMGYPENENIEKSAWLFVDGTPDRVGGEGNIPVFMFGVKQWSVYAGKLGFSIEKDEWYHIAGVFKNKILSLYIDGILFAEAEYSKPVSFTENFYIGATPGVQNGFYLKGSVSEARLWTRALTSSELKNPLHKCFVEVDSKDLEGYWKLDDLSDTCQDYTGHGHTATKVGNRAIEWITKVPCP